MKALITGSTSGIGRDMARYLAHKKIDLILIGRNINSLKRLKDELKTNVKIYEIDLVNKESLKKVINIIYNEKIDILINNAGFGLCDSFSDINLNMELKMIDLNIKVMHILFKHALKAMEGKNNTYILNVASFAAFTPGPKMASYYATKAYVLRLTEAVYYEEKKRGNKTSISLLCPGPTKTNFSNVAKVKFNAPLLESEFVARYAIKQMFKRKFIIIPSFKYKVLAILIKITPVRLLLPIFNKIHDRIK